jgi:hypothetical protein
MWTEQIRSRAKLVCGLATLAAFAGCGQESDATVEETPAVSALTAVQVAANRPPGVPGDYVVTPAGYFHPSCVVGITEDESLGAGTITGKDGKTRAVSKCGYPRYDRKGAVLPAQPSASARTAAVPPPAFSGWVESGNNGDNGPLNWIAANWKVPSAPAVNAGQTIYLFPGIQPLDSPPNYTILQPVLGWYNGQWTIQSWNCCVDGTAVNAPAANVNAGDTIYGYVQGNVCNAAGVCSQWQVYTGDWTNGRHSTLNTTAFGNRMGWAFGAVLEVYDIGACNHYPASGSIPFTNIQVRNTGYQQIYPLWHTGWTSDSPQCGYGVTSPNTNTITLKVVP